MNKINVMHLITGLGMGGAEKIVLDLAKYSSDETFNICVVGMSKRDELFKEFLDSRIETQLLNKTNSIRDVFSIVCSVNKIVKEKKIRIIHAHMTHSIIMASILKVLNPSLKIVYTSHNFNIGSKFREFVVWSLKCFRDVDIVFSEDILKYFYKSNYQVIPNGIKIDKYDLRLKRNEEFTFIAVGRLEVVKNHKYLIEIVNDLKKYYNFKLLIVGEGCLKNELDSLIKANELEDKVCLLGLRNDIPDLLNKSHCLLMPSLWEGLPIVILEAGASHLPVISTSVGSIPSLLNSDNSYLGGVDLFKSNMIKVLKDYELSKNKAKLLFEIVSQNYSIDSIVSKHEKLYKSLLFTR